MPPHIVRELELGRELVKALGEVEVQIQEIRNTAIEMGVAVYKIRDTSGGFMYAPMLAAKAQLLSALTTMNRRER